MPIRDRFDATGHPVKNILLRSIPLAEFGLVQGHLKHVTIAVGDTLHDPSRGIAYAYFLNSGLASLLVGANSGKTVEVGIAGPEGVTGVCALAGLNRTVHRAVMHAAGDGFRIRASTLRKIVVSTPVLRQKANLFAAVQSMQIAQTAACNRLHDIGQRMARWLLMTSDRVGAQTLSVTHDFLSTLLGTDRASVTERAVLLQARGAIQYSRGKLRIVERKKLESSACECYGALRQFNRELGLA
jgi:CRP-like cAMP-binding protein